MIRVLTALAVVLSLWMTPLATKGQTMPCGHGHQEMALCELFCDCDTACSALMVARIQAPSRLALPPIRGATVVKTRFESVVLPGVYKPPIDFV